MKYGSLFSGYGGLDLAVESVLGGSCAWHCELDPNAARVLAARWPDTPNLGDITAVDWHAVEPVDVLCGGFPCQDISSAGRGAGIKEGTRSGLWYRYADAVRVLRPRLVFVENVAVLLVRGLDVVLGDLAALGYDAAWTCLRASDVGAPHRRERLFLVARDAGGAVATDADDPTVDRERTRPEPRRRGAGPVADPEGAERRGAQLEAMGSAAGPAAEPGERPGAPAPAADTDSDGTRRPTQEQDPRRKPRARTADGHLAPAWGPYAPAITRWEHALGRPAPAPVDERGRLSPHLVEWMMGLPAGWVTDVLDRRPALHALGNGVVPQQGAMALAMLLDGLDREVAA